MEGNIQFIATSPEHLRDSIVKEVVQNLVPFMSAKEEPDQLLTREETAKFLSINLTTLRVWTKAKKFPAYGIAGRVYYKKSELINSLIPLNK